MYILSFVPNLLTITSIEKTILQYFLEILEEMLLCYIMHSDSCSRIKLSTTLHYVFKGSKSLTCYKIKTL